MRSMRRRYVALTLVIGMQSMAAPQNAWAADGAVPAMLLGGWAGPCTADLPSTFSIAMAKNAVLLTAGRRSRRLTGRRNVTVRRWYLDFDCMKDAPLNVDINLIDPKQLLLAERPLGVACTYKRVP